MLSVFDGLRDVTTLSVFVRLACALICGGIIGIERSYKRRPAGFRTHILICIGAAITTLTSQYLYLNMHYFTDMARLGAQVVAGIGFIGAGTIINQLKSQNVQIYDIDIERNKSGEALHPSAIFSIRLNEKIPHTQLLSDLAELDCFCVIEEL